MWWRKKHNVSYTEWIYYPWYKAIRYTRYQPWKNNFEDAIVDIVDGIKSLSSGVFNLTKTLIQWVFSPILKPLAVIRWLPKIRQSEAEERDRRFKEWQDRIEAIKRREELSGE